MKTNSITITYLSKVSFASLNGSDKEVDNINPIKKITLANGEELPYVSSQALRRALRDRLEEMGFEISVPKIGDGGKTVITSTDASRYIDDDLFGFMDASNGYVRTSPVRVESLVALSKYEGDLDYGVNFMGKGQIKDSKGKVIQPIFESEIHSGIYRGTILIELDRIGCEIEKDAKGIIVRENGVPKIKHFLNNKQRSERVLAFLNAFRNLWSSGRQTRFLADISPKFIAAASMKVKNPIFLEAVNADKNGQINFDKLNSVLIDYEPFIEDSVLAGQEAVFNLGEGVTNLKEGFTKIESWIKSYYAQ